MYSTSDTNQIINVCVGISSRHDEVERILSFNAYCIVLHIEIYLFKKCKMTSSTRVLLCH